MHKWPCEGTREPQTRDEFSPGSPSKGARPCRHLSAHKLSGMWMDCFCIMLFLYFSDFIQKYVAEILPC